MRKISFIILAAFLFVAAANSYGQPAADVLVTGKGVRITAADLSPSLKKAYDSLPASLAASRSQLLSGYLADLLQEAEAKARGISVEALQAERLRTVPDPPDADIAQIYELNRNAFASRSLAEARGTIIEFLRREPEQKALQSFVDELQKKHGLVLVKDINSADIKGVDIIARVASRTILYREFEDAFRFSLADAAAHIYDDFRVGLEDEILAALVTLEAKERNTDASGIIAAEITNKMREYSEDERLDLEDAMRRKLFAKYDVRFVYKQPFALIQKVAIEGEPALGNAAAPVTVVMFSDYQCPACAGTHPILKRVIKEYGDRVRLVVRDFPLESIHTEAFAAAVAANAANAQGKYWEYVELLYSNQEALDAASLKRYAELAGLDLKRFEADIAADSVALEIRSDLSDGRGHGVNGTPTIFVNGVKVHRLTASAFRDAIEAGLKK